MGESSGMGSSSSAEDIMNQAMNEAMANAEGTFFMFSIVSLLINIGICVLMINICKRIALTKGLPKSYMWFGLLGIIGVIIVVVMQPRQQNHYDQYGNPYNQNPYGQNQNPYNWNQNNQNPYGQNPYNQNTYGQNQYNQYGQNMYNENQYNYGQFTPQDTNQQGFTLNGEEYSGNHNVTTCSKCGASMSGETDFCPFCGNKVK